MSCPEDIAAGPAHCTELARLREEVTRLRECERTYRALLQHAPVLISTKDLDGTILSASRHFEMLDGVDPAHFVGRNLFDLFPREIANELWRNDQRAARERRPIHSEECVYHRDNTLHTYATVKFPLYDADGRVVATGAVSTDITDVKAARHDSVTDELTGLKNRRYFNMRFCEEQRRAHRDQRILTMLLADVDRFKDYNDHYGHPQGDTVLVSVAHALRATLNRPGDLAFRIGGDEFACLFATSHADESRELAERLRSHVAAQAIVHAANPPFDRVTLSIGVACLTPERELPQGQAYQLGDQALYRAKHQGRNCVAS